MANQALIQCLTDREREILSFIDDQGLTAPIVIQARLLQTRLAVQHALDNLWRAQQIQRPVKGLVVSNKWLKNNRKDKRYIEGVFNISLVDPK